MQIESSIILKGSAIILIKTSRIIVIIWEKVWKKAYLKKKILT